MHKNKYQSLGCLKIVKIHTISMVIVSRIAAVYLGQVEEWSAVTVHQDLGIVVHEQTKVKERTGDLPARDLHHRQRYVSSQRGTL